MKTNSRMMLFLMTTVSANIVHGQSNLLPNGDFSETQGVNGWTASGTGTMDFFATIDAENSPTSGSMSLFPSMDHNPELATSTCFPVKPLANFSFGGKYVQTEMLVSGTGTMSCKSYSNSSCTSGESDLGSTPGGDIYESNANAEFSSWVPVNGTLNNSALAVRCTVSAFDDEYGLIPLPSNVEFDDLYFDLQDSTSTGVKLGGYFSGSWYDPTRSGQGFALEFTAQANSMTAIWFTYSPFGNSTEWIYGGGVWDPTQSSITVPAVLTSGAYFGFNFVGADVQKTPWGTLTFAFTDCNNALLTWNSTLPSYGSGTEHLKRLTSIAGLSCPQ